MLGAVADRVYGEPSRRLKVLGITGTNGKTTTSYLVEAGLAAAGLGTGLIGTVADPHPRPRRRRRADDHRHPERPHHARGARAARPARRHGRPTASRRSSWRSPATRWSRAGSAASASPRPGSPTSAATTWTSTATSRPTSRPRRCCSTAGPPSRWSTSTTTPAAGSPRPDRPRAGHRLHRRAPRRTGRPTDIAAAPDGGSTFTLHGPDGRSWPARLLLPGRFNVANAVLAVALLDAVGVPVEAALAGLAETVVPGRMEPVDAGQPFVAVVDYAHTPDAVATALARAARRDRRPADHRARLRRRPRRRQARRRWARPPPRGSDVLVVTDDNPRSEDPAAIRAAMLAGVDEVPPSRPGRGARGRATGAPRWRPRSRLARPGDTLLVAGKGHETGQEIAGEVLPFDDRAVLREVLDRPGGAPA